MRRPGTGLTAFLGVVVLVAGCRREAPRADAIAPGRVTSPRTATAPRIDRLYPAEARAGVPFNVQPGGGSAIAVLGSGFRRSDVIFWNGRPLATTFGTPGLLTAVVPSPLIAAPADVTVEVRSAVAPKDAAGSAVFKILPQPRGRPRVGRGINSTSGARVPPKGRPPSGRA